MDKDYSLDALSRFLDYVADKGIMKAETAKGRKVAANRIFEKLTPEQRHDLRLVDLDAEAERFANRQGTEYTPSSLTVYKSRVKSAMTDFLSYVENPMVFKPSVVTRAIAPRSAGKAGGSRGGNGGDNTPRAPSNAHTEPSSPAPQGTAHDHLVFPIPIRPGLIVKVTNIPSDLTGAEAEKIAQVVRALACSE